MAENAAAPQTEDGLIRKITAASLSRRLNDAGYGVQVMAYHERGRAVSGRAFVSHHGHRQEELRKWLVEHGLRVDDFGAGTFDVSLPHRGR